MSRAGGSSVQQVHKKCVKKRGFDSGGRMRSPQPIFRFFLITRYIVVRSQVTARIKDLPGFFPKNITPRETEVLEVPNRSETTRNRKFRQFCNSLMVRKKI